MVEKNKLENSIKPIQIFIITGYSGAGKSTVLRALEDSGFLCVDNLPTPLLHEFFMLLQTNGLESNNVALGLDVRSGFTSHTLREALNNLGPFKQYVSIIFLSAASTTIIKRFQETRRKHPLAGETDIIGAIEYEKQLMKPLLEMADEVINTDQLTIHELRNLMYSSHRASGDKKILVSLISFGFKFGIPPESNFIFDVSSLPNPYFVPELKNLTGLHDEVQKYLFSQEAVQLYWNSCREFILQALKRSYEEGRLSITIAFGCTGGRHRSVAFINMLSQMDLAYVQFMVRHRDIDNERGRYTHQITQENR